MTVLISLEIGEARAERRGRDQEGLDHQEGKACQFQQGLAHVDVIDVRGNADREKYEQRKHGEAEHLPHERQGPEFAPHRMSFALIGHQEHRFGGRRCDGEGEPGMRHGERNKPEMSPSPRRWRLRRRRARRRAGPVLQRPSAHRVRRPPDRAAPSHRRERRGRCRAHVAPWPRTREPAAPTSAAWPARRCLSPLWQRRQAIQPASSPGRAASASTRYRSPCRLPVLQTPPQAALIPGEEGISTRVYRIRS